MKRINVNLTAVQRDSLSFSANIIVGNAVLSFVKNIVVIVYLYFIQGKIQPIASGVESVITAFMI
jgi:hypothetical protein